MPFDDEVKRVSQKIEKVVSRFHLKPPRLMRQHQLAHHTSKTVFLFFSHQTSIVTLLLCGHTGP